MSTSPAKEVPWACRAYAKLDKHNTAKFMSKRLSPFQYLLTHQLQPIFKRIRNEQEANES